MKDINHNNLPEAISYLLEEVAHIKQLLQEKSNLKATDQTEELLTVPQCATFLSLSIASVYGLIHRKELPTLKRSKRCYFLKEDLIQYLKDGRISTAEEINAAAETFIKSKNGKA